MEKHKIKPFLTFNGNAEVAMRFYSEHLPETKITKLIPYGKDHPFAKDGGENKILMGKLSLMGQEIMFLDMTEAHPAPNFNWAMSLYIDCRNEIEFDMIFNVLSKEGAVMMGPESIEGFRKCAWVTDKFGVTWQPVWE